MLPSWSYFADAKSRPSLLNESNSHCYLCYHKHDPTTDINAFNATALLISFLHYRL